MGTENPQRDANNARQEIWDFVSAPALHPMKVTVHTNKPGTAPGFIFVAPYTLYGTPMIGQTGALIMDQAGNPVWFRPLNKYTQNRNFRVQSCFGHPVLTLWQGTISGTETAHPQLPIGDPLPGAHFQIINQNYQVIKTITAQYGFTAGVHEFIITSRNTALFTATKPVPADLSPYGGPIQGYIDNYSIQEIDLVTGELVFFWDVLSHIDPADSMASVSSAANTNNIWDCFHMNSIAEGPDNTLLVSMRDMWAIYNIDKKSGNVIWQLGGKQSDFTFSPDASFSWQHDARYRSKTQISLFDNACCASANAKPDGPAHGLILRLDYRNMTAKMDRTYYHDPLLYVSHRGNMQQLPNSNQFIGWGAQPFLSEFKYAGNMEAHPAFNLLYDMQFSGANFSYRAFKNEWIGLPLYPPDIAAVQSGKGFVTVFASWNGATEVRAWQVFAGLTPYDLSPVVPGIPKNGFETAIPVYSAGPYFQVNGLNAKGKLIGRSRVSACNSGKI